MHVPDNVRLDALWKRALQRGFSSTLKDDFEEAITDAGWPLFGQDIWSADSLIPTPDPPLDTASPVEVHSDLVLTEDPSVGDHLVHVACSTPGDLSTRLSRWIPPRYGRAYHVRLYEDDGSGGLGPAIPTSDPIGWFFFGTGVLWCAIDPDEAGKTLPLHLSGYRYIGDLGVAPPSVASDKTFEHVISDVSPVTSVLVTHNLLKHPTPFMIGKIGGAGSPVIIEPAGVVYNTTSTMTLTFDDAVSGTIYLN